MSGRAALLKVSSSAAAAWPCAGKAGPLLHLLHVVGASCSHTGPTGTPWPQAGLRDGSLEAAAGAGPLNGSCGDGGSGGARRHAHTELWLVGTKQYLEHHG